MNQSSACGAAAVLCVFLLCSVQGAAQTQAAGLTKIGVFEPGSVFEQSELGKKMKADIEALTKRKRSEVQSLEAELRAMQDKFRQEEPSLSEERLNERERQLQQKSIELKRLRDDANREVQAQVADIEQAFQREVLKVIEALGREGEYALIFDRAAVAFVAPAVDITSEIVGRMNTTQSSASKSR
ncbi:MAG: OmpH family outer membrane protein [Acidobacteriota bacterium]